MSETPVPPVAFVPTKRTGSGAASGVTLVENITDINDKIRRRRDPRRGALGRAAREMTATYIATPPGSGYGRPDQEPLASETLPEIVG